MADFHFIRPLFLLFIPAGLLLSYFLWNHISTISNWRQICDSHLIDHLLVGKKLKNSSLPYLIMIVAWIIAALALAGPTWERLPQPVHNVLEGRVIVFDLSRSMDSTDVEPTRLIRARYKLSDLITAGRGLQQGLVVFAGDAFVVAPLTEDSGTLINLTASLTTNTVPVQGSRTDLGLELGASLFTNAGLTSGDIVLMTDGASSGSTKIAATIKAQGFKISVMAIGTATGGPVQMANGELLKDASGDIVIPGVDHRLLKKISGAGGGRYVEMSSSNDDIERLMQADVEDLELSLIQGLSESTVDKQYSSDQWSDAGPWLVLPLLMIVALGFRRGWILSLTILMLPLSPQPVHAFGWDDLWWRADQQAEQLFSEEKFEQLPEHAPTDWQGAAQYMSSDFKGAADTWSIDDANNSVAHYNRGNALAQIQSFQESIAAYDRALEIDPDHEDARFNRALVEEMLKQQQQQQQQGENSQNDDQSNNDQSQEKTGQEGGQESNQQNQQQSRELEEANQGRIKNNNDDSESSESEPTADQSDPDETAARKQNQKSQAAQDVSDESEQISENEQEQLNEQQQAMEQWLQRIPDDPGGLLRRKFAYQYSLRPQQTRQQQW